jgi:hypothetical protein
MIYLDVLSVVRRNYGDNDDGDPRGNYSCRILLFTCCSGFVKTRRLLKVSRGWSRSSFQKPHVRSNVGSKTLNAEL